jgi:hypothetical protein
MTRPEYKRTPGSPGFVLHLVRMQVEDVPGPLIELNALAGQGCHSSIGAA